MRIHPGVWIGISGMALGIIGFGMGAVAVSKSCRVNADCAEWVQAVGSLVALVVAILIPIMLQLRQGKELALREQARARTAALQLLPQLSALKRRANAVTNWDGTRIDGIPRYVHPELGGGAEGVRIEQIFRDDRSWDSLMPHIDALGASSIRVQIAVKMVRDLAVCYANALAVGGLDVDPLAVQYERSRVRECELALDRAVRELEALFPTPEIVGNSDAVVWSDRRITTARPGSERR